MHVIRAAHQLAIYICNVLPASLCKDVPYEAPQLPSFEMVGQKTFFSIATATALVGAAPTVTIDAGRVIGAETTIAGSSRVVNKFLGIPFAQSPPKRFAPPVPPRRWRQPLRATTHKPACMQQFNCRTTSFENGSWVDEL